MKIDLTNEQISRFKAFLEASEDCEALTGGEWVADIYEADKPVTLTLSLTESGAEIEGAEYLAYDDASDGWYMSSPVESAEAVLEALRVAGAI